MLIAPILVVLCAAPPSSAADAGHHQRASKEIFTVKKLTDDVYALAGRGGNIGFAIGPDSVLVVDSQFKDLAAGIEAKIKTVTTKPIKWLVNTHHHGDHTGGNAHFRQFALILGHDNMRKRMVEFPATVLKTFPAQLEEAKRKGEKDDVKWLEEQIAWASKVKIEEVPAPVVTFATEMNVHLGELTVRIWHTPPAHTDGDSVVYFEKSKVLHMGDLFFNQLIPFIDAKSGGSVNGYLAAIDGVLSQISDDVTIIPGHGEVATVAQLKTFRKYIFEVLAAAKAAREKKLTKEAFLAGVDLPEYRGWNGYADRFKQNAGLAFDESK